MIFFYFNFLAGTPGKKKVGLPLAGVRYQGVPVGGRFRPWKFLGGAVDSHPPVLVFFQKTVQGLGNSPLFAGNQRGIAGGRRGSAEPGLPKALFYPPIFIRQLWINPGRGFVLFVFARLGPKDFQAEGMARLGGGQVFGEGTPWPSAEGFTPNFVGGRDWDGRGPLLEGGESGWFFFFSGRWADFDVSARISARKRFLTKKSFCFLFFVTGGKDFSRMLSAF